MISNFKKIKNFGIYASHTNEGLHDFGKLNLIHGWNGSGKSTLSELFECLEMKSRSSKFPGAEFIVSCAGDVTLTERNVATSQLNIKVFNKRFVDQNINWDNAVKSILLVAKEKIDERKRLEELTAKQSQEAASIAQKNKAISDADLAISQFSTDTARRIKASLQTIDTGDSYYFNYNKSKLDQFIGQAGASIEAPESILDAAEVSALIVSAQPKQKPRVDWASTPIEADRFAKARERLADLLMTTAVSATIPRLAENATVRVWVEHGLEIHRGDHLTECEFCRNPLSEERLTEIEGHFSQAYREFKQRLEKAQGWLASQKIDLGPLPDERVFYDEFSERFADRARSMAVSAQLINGAISNWEEALRRKAADVFDKTIVVEDVNPALINRFNEASSAIVELTKAHNDKSANFASSTKASKRALELHYAATEVDAFALPKKKAAVAELKVDVQKLRSDSDSRKQEMLKIEQSLSNEGLGADRFNESLRRFLGRDELALRFNPALKGYEIIRNGGDRHDGNLSEGEKTAIAFIYFVTKLEESDNAISDTIVVVDDPVSSFDSNHLFHSYSFLRSRCKAAKQLFVLTHNFTYFKLVRDWFLTTNRNRASSKPPKAEVAFFYTIESSSTSPRFSKIKRADSTLVDFNSEYHYFFSRLHSFRSQPSLSRDDAFLTANLARKLMESFLSFKFPRANRDLNSLFSRALKGCVVTNEETKEKIYRFINKYSHSAVVEVNEDSFENMLGESYSVVGDIFVWMKEIDKDHFEEMEEVLRAEA